MKNNESQQELFPPVEKEAARSLLDQLLSDSKLYHSSKSYKELLDFIVRLRNFAPFNAMLLQVQKPGLSYAASAGEWLEKFGRVPKDGARPLLILWPFGPVALVCDVRNWGQIHHCPLSPIPIPRPTSPLKKQIPIRQKKSLPIR